MGHSQTASTFTEGVAAFQQDNQMPKISDATPAAKQANHKPLSKQELNSAQHTNAAQTGPLGTQTPQANSFSGDSLILQVTTANANDANQI